jgi:hypothetical protein
LSVGIAFLLMHPRRVEDTIMQPDEELLDLIEWAFLDAQIDGETLSLAFAWVESNDIQVH